MKVSFDLLVCTPRFLSEPRTLLLSVELTHVETRPCYETVPPHVRNPCYS